MMIKQENNWSCFAVVAAMVTGTTPDDVYEFVGHDGSLFDDNSEHPDKRCGFKLKEIAKYLLEHNLLFGTFFDVDNSVIDFSKETTFQSEVTIAKVPAIVTVESETLEGCLHTVYWDGEYVRDPNPDAPDERCLWEYNIKEWIPIVYLLDD